MHPALRDVDWAAQDAAALALLRDLLRFDTSNWPSSHPAPGAGTDRGTTPGHEGPCAAFAAEHLHASGLEPQLLAAVPDRPNVIARLRGDGGEPPLMLSAHLDVVPAEADRWTHPPFGGEVHDGWVWGRGAIDMKHMAAMSLIAVRLLARSGVALRRDVIVSLVADEEDGCAHGSQWLVAEHPETVRAGFVLGEVGGFTLHIGGRPLYPVQVAEKGVCWIQATAHGATGHGSMPRSDNAVVRLASFLHRLGSTKLPVQRSAALDRFVTELAATQGLPARAVLPLLLQPQLSGALTDLIGLREAGVARMLDAVVRNTATPTMLSAGTRVNVIPGGAQAQIDGRIAVGSSQAQLLAELRRLAGDHVTLEVVKGDRAPSEHPIDTELFGVIGDVVGAHHPGAAAIPSITPGFTDAHFWAQLGAVCYGFSPVRLEPGGPSFGDLFHGDDERIPVDGFTAGVRMLADVVLRFCAA
jgi:acetylornithine deacetylase/succinyl-diaminopimelate desuccinylase-like protein